jgi:hypothetical protein
LGPLSPVATNKPIVPAPGDYDGEIDGTVLENPPQCCFVHQNLLFGFLWPTIFKPKIKVLTEYESVTQKVLLLVESVL